MIELLIIFLFFLFYGPITQNSEGVSATPDMSETQNQLNHDATTADAGKTDPIVAAAARCARLKAGEVKRICFEKAKTINQPDVVVAQDSQDSTNSDIPQETKLTENEEDTITFAAQCVFAANVVDEIAKNRGVREDSADSIAVAALASLTDIPNQEEVVAFYLDSFNKTVELAKNLDEDQKLKIFGPVFVACGAEYRG